MRWTRIRHPFWPRTNGLTYRGQTGHFPFSRVCRVTFSFTDKLCPNCASRYASTPDWIRQNSRSRLKVRVKLAKNSIYQTVYRTTFSFGDRLRPNCTRRCASTAAWIKVKKIPDQGQSQGQWAIDFFIRCTTQLCHLPTDCAQIAPGCVHRHQLAPRQRKFQVKVKCAKNSIFQTICRKTSSFTYQPFDPALPQKLCIETSLDQDEENFRSRSNLRLNDPKTRFLDGILLNFFLLTTDRFQISFKKRYLAYKILPFLALTWIGLG